MINNFNVGHADTAAYALQGKALAERGTLDVHYITNFYHDYGDEILRHDDHWPHFQGLFYAPAFYFFGSNASVARQCNLFMGAVLLPLAAAWFLVALTGLHWPVGLMALLVLCDGFIFKSSTGLMADNSLCGLLVAFAAALISSKRFHPSFLILTGVLGALAWACKGSQILLLPYMIMAAVVIHGIAVLKSRWLLLGVIIFLGMMSPRVLENLKDHQRPFHSTQNYVSAYFGLTDHPWGNWDQNFYGVYWGEDLPSPYERFEDQEKFFRSVQANVRVALGTLLMGNNSVHRRDRSLSNWEKMGGLSRSLGLALTEEPYGSRLSALSEAKSDLPWITPISEWPNGWISFFQIIGFFLAVISVPLLPFVWIWRVVKKRGSLGFFWRSYFVLGILILMHISFSIVFWYVMPRLIMTVQPICFALGLAPLLIVAKKVMECFCEKAPVLMQKIHSEKLRDVLLSKWSSLPKVVILLSAGVWSVLGYMVYSGIESWQEEMLLEHPVRVHSRPYYPHYHRVVQAMENVVPSDAVIMTRNPWQLLFYCPEDTRTVGLPYAEPRILLAIAKRYRVTHLMAERYRPGLTSFLRSGHPGVKKVLSWPQAVYEIDYSAFAPGEIASLEELKGHNRKLLGNTLRDPSP